MRVLALLGVATATACYSPQLRDCALACGVANACPDGLLCGSDGWCRTDPSAPACPCTCDPLQQSCCGGGQACDLVAPEYLAECREITASGGQGIRCLAPEECGRSFTCLIEPDATDGTCHGFCATDTDCEGGSAGGLCEPGPEASGLKVCTTPCNPIDAQGCPSEFTCIIFLDGGGRAWTDCRVHGGGDNGASCSGHADCKRGKLCHGTPGVCTEYCSTSNPSCPDSGTCLPLDPISVVIAGTEWGYCG